MNKNTGGNRDIDYVREQLMKIDRDITMPESLRGGNLRPSIEAVYLPGGVKKIQRESVRPPLTIWKSVLGYAAAFVLIVGAFYGLGVNQSGSPSVIDGVIEIEEEPNPMMRAFSEEESLDTEDAVVPETAQQFDTFALHDEPDAGSGADALPEGARPVDGADTFAVPTPADGSFAGNVGGSGKATKIKSTENYSFYYRQNDASDPDKESPISLEIVETASAVPVSQFELDAVSKVLELYTEEDRLVVIGRLFATDSELAPGIGVLLFDIGDISEPVQTFRINQPGEYMASQYYEGVVTVATSCEEGDEPVLRIQENGISVLEPAGERIELPNRTADSFMMVSALNMQSGSHSSASFLGGDDGISLYDDNGFITYNAGQPEKPGQSVTGMAKILLDGLSITLDNKEN